MKRYSACSRIKSCVSVILFFAVALQIKAQAYPEHIRRDEFYLIRTGPERNDTLIVSLSMITSTKIAEQVFGTNYTAKSYLNNLNEKSYTGMVYDNGLEIYIPDEINQSENIIFHIKSDGYKLLNKDGKEIQVGMKGSDLEPIFPVSFSRRKVITNKEGKPVKITFAVYFASYKNNEILIEDSSIEFILSRDGSLLEEFYSFQPW
jgi:hypothetical protein